MDENLEIRNKTKEILLKKLEQIIVLIGNNGLELSEDWFYTSIPNGKDGVNKIKFKIINPIEINKNFFDAFLKKHNIKYKISKNKRSYYFYLTKK